MCGSNEVGCDMFAYCMMQLNQNTSVVYDNVTHSVLKIVNFLSPISGYCLESILDSNKNSISQIVIIHLYLPNIQNGILAI